MSQTSPTTSSPTTPLAPAAPTTAPAELPAALRRAGVDRPGGVNARVRAGGYGRAVQSMAQVPRAGVVVPVLRRVIGDELRRRRVGQGRTLREVSSAARVSLGYLSEVERGQKEASSELLASICDALEVPMSVVLRSVSDEVAGHEAAAHRGRIARLSEVSDRPVAAGDPVAPAA